MIKKLPKFSTVLLITTTIAQPALACESDEGKHLPTQLVPCTMDADGEFEDMDIDSKGVPMETFACTTTSPPKKRRKEYSQYSLSTIIRDRPVRMTSQELAQEAARAVANKRKQLLQVMSIYQSSLAHASIEVEQKKSKPKPRRKTPAVLKRQAELAMREIEATETRTVRQSQQSRKRNRATLEGQANEVANNSLEAEFQPPRKRFKQTISLSTLIDLQLDQGDDNFTTDQIERYQRHAKRGDAWAQTMLGSYYLKQACSLQDPVRFIEQAIRWYEKAAENDCGNFEALYKLGRIRYSQGSYEEAFKLLKRAAWMQDANAQAMLGHLYRTGKGVEKSLSTASEWFNRAADRGSSAAKAILAAWNDKIEE